MINLFRSNYHWLIAFAAAAALTGVLYVTGGLSPGPRSVDYFTVFAQLKDRSASAGKSPSQAAIGNKASSPIDWTPTGSIRQEQDVSRIGSKYTRHPDKRYKLLRVINDGVILDVNGAISLYRTGDKIDDTTLLLDISNDRNGWFAITTKGTIR